MRVSNYRVRRVKQHMRYGLSNRSKAGTGTKAGRHMRYLAGRIKRSGKAKRYVNKYRR